MSPIQKQIPTTAAKIEEPESNEDGSKASRHTVMLTKNANFASFDNDSCDKRRFIAFSENVLV